MAKRPVRAAGDQPGTPGRGSEAPSSGQSGSPRNVYQWFCEEVDALVIGAADSAVSVVGELTRAVKRAQMVVDGELAPIDERDRQR